MDVCSRPGAGAGGHVPPFRDRSRHGRAIHASRRDIAVFRDAISRAADARALMFADEESPQRVFIGRNQFDMDLASGLRYS
jgi:hypothetical protein